MCTSLPCLIAMSSCQKGSLSFTSQNSATVTGSAGDHHRGWRPGFPVDLHDSSWTADAMACVISFPHTVADGAADIKYYEGGGGKPTAESTVDANSTPTATTFVLPTLIHGHCCFTDAPLASSSASAISIEQVGIARLAAVGSRVSLPSHLRDCCGPELSIYWAL